MLNTSTYRTPVLRFLVSEFMVPVMGELLQMLVWVFFCWVWRSRTTTSLQGLNPMLDGRVIL